MIKEQLLLSERLQLRHQPLCLRKLTYLSVNCQTPVITDTFLIGRASNVTNFGDAFEIHL